MLIKTHFSNVNQLVFGLRYWTIEKDHSFSCKLNVTTEGINNCVFVTFDYQSPYYNPYFTEGLIEVLINLDQSRIKTGIKCNSTELHYLEMDQGTDIKKGSLIDIKTGIVIGELMD